MVLNSPRVMGGRSSPTSMRPVSRLSTWRVAGALQQKARQEVVAAGRGETERDGACLARCDASRRQRCAFRQPQDAPGFQQEHPPCRCQLHSAAGAVQKLDPQYMLQQLDLPRQWRLCHVHPRCGATEMQFLGRCDKAAKLAKFEL
jgi:hypothetical protein